MAVDSNKAAVSRQCYCLGAGEHRNCQLQSPQQKPDLVSCLEIPPFYLFLAEARLRDPSSWLQQPVFNVVTLMNSEN